MPLFHLTLWQPMNKILQKISLDLIQPQIILTLLFFAAWVSLDGYEVSFEGIENPDTLKLIQSTCQLEKLKESPPATVIGLKRRAEGDIKNIIQALQSQGYYDAKVAYQVDEEGKRVIVQIEPGPIFPFVSFELHFFQDGERTPAFDDQICLEELGIQIGDPALPELILDAEDKILDFLNLNGYAFASIRKREVMADQQQKNVNVVMEIEIGPLAYFGPLTIIGLDRVKEAFIYKKLHWRKDELYDPRKVEKTQEELELSGLFRSVTITHEEQSDGGNLIPFTIHVVEGKQRSIGIGVSYVTSWGPGINLEWEDRNIFGEGQKLSFEADIWQRRQEGDLTYVIPDFRRKNQNLIFILDYEYEKTIGFTESTFSISGTIERKLTDKLRVYYGGMYKHIRSTDSDRNGTFDLLQVPLQLKWTNVDNLLDPTRGGMFHIKVMPTVQYLEPQFGYCLNTFTGSLYYSLTSDARHVLAGKLMLGTIIGASQNDIPPPERFYAGTQNALRGYKYLSVSPLNHHHKPIGGRSLMIGSLELRSRISKDFGWVFFYDVGNVFLRAYPDFRESVLQSVGLGIRYYTPVGPLRVDVAVPLNRRPHVDGPFQVYFSIGQTF